MEIILPSCRTNLTRYDIQFICSVLAPEQDESVALEHFLQEQEGLDQVLDHEDLLDSILNSTTQLQVSPQLYFYILVRHVLKKTGNNNREVADYIASLLCNNVEADPNATSPRNALFYAVDLLEKLQYVSHSEKFFIMAQIANQSLFVTGIFPDYIRQRAERKAAPNLKFYESIGRSHYMAARDHRLAQEFHLDSVFEALSCQFVETRKALNELGDAFLFLDKPDGMKWDGLFN